MLRVIVHDMHKYDCNMHSITFAANCKDAQLAIYDGYENYEFNPKEPKRYCGDLRYYKGVEDKVELSASNRLLIR